jgi:hypothetical protein
MRKMRKKAFLTLLKEDSNLIPFYIVSYFSIVVNTGFYIIAGKGKTVY